MSMANVPNEDNIYRFELPNGIVLLVYENFAVELVTVDGLARAGALAEAADQAGLAAFTAAMLMRGTKSRDFAQIYDDLEAVGASLSFAGGRHATSFGGDCLSEDLDLVLGLMAESLRAATFPEAQVEQVRGEIMTRLQIRANDTGQRARLAFHETLFGLDHPYGRSSQGYLETISALTRADLMAFHERYFGPTGLILVIVGAINAADAHEKVLATLGDWQNAAQAAMPAVPPATRPAGVRRIDVPMPDKSQSDVILGLPGPARDVADYLDASLANTILGIFGMMGRLGKSVREEQGLAYYVYSQLQGSLGPLPWFVSTGVAPDKVEQAIDSIRAEIRRIQTEPVPAAELADSQAYRTGSLPVSLETNEGLASVISDMEFLGLGLNYLRDFPAQMNEITATRVQASAQKHFSADDIVIAVAGPPADEV